MQFIKIRCDKKDKKTIENCNINLQYIESLLSCVLNSIRPKRTTNYHILRLRIIKDECSQYTFNNAICIRKDIFEMPEHQVMKVFIEDLLHEFCHYIQYVVDDVPFKEFASDIKNVTKKYYWNNKTEVQARNFEKMMPAIIGLYNGMRKNMRYYKSLKNETKKEGKATKRNKRRTHSKIKRRN
jgi:hypothetical protein